MKLQTKSYIFLLLFFFTSCTAKKVVTEYKETIKTDTIYKTKTIKEVQRFTDTLTIENPCDSLTGKLKPFKQLIKTKQGNISLTGLNNVITQEIDLKGYKDQLEQTYKSKYEKFTKNYNKETVRYKVPFYHWLIHLICGLVIFLLIRLRLF
jgi:hypothetical protein